MNFQFNLNETFPGSHNSVIKIGQDLLPDDFNTFTSNSRNFHQIQQRVSMTKIMKLHFSDFNKSLIMTRIWQNDKEN